MANDKAGELITPKQKAQMLHDRSEFDRDGRCLHIFSNEFLEKFGYYHVPEKVQYGYKDSKGIWVQSGLHKGRPVAILSAVRTIEGTTEADVIGSGQDGKYPGE